MNNNKYNFGGRLTEEFPSQINVDLTDQCNLACIHCSHTDYVKSKHYSKIFLPNEFNTKMIDEVKLRGKGKTQYVRYTGSGEPLLHSKVFTILEYAVKNSGTTISLTTNGTIMNKEKAKKLVDIGVHVIDISIDAFKPETYKTIRKNGKLEVTKRNILNLIDYIKKKGSKTKVVVSFIEQKENEGEADDFEKFWNNAGANYVVVRRLHSDSGLKQELAVSKRNELKDKERRPCLYPWERIVLKANGKISFCPSDWIGASSIVNISQKTISETWKGNFYKQLRNAHIENNYSKHSFCEQCPDWNLTKWPDDGRSYANMVEEFKDNE